MPQKVLIITYYWPPAGGPGVQRWLKFVKYLPEFSFEPIVYCPENPSYPIEDKSLLRDIPKDITVLKQPISEPYKLANLFSKKTTKSISSGVIPKKEKQSLLERLLLFIRGNFFIPDARKNWINPSVHYLSSIIKKENIKTVITTGPPHSMHVIGLRLKRNHNITWLADFRDPWTTIGYHKALKLLPFAMKEHQNLELEVLRSADIITVTSSHTKKEFRTKTNQPIKVITNGYDEHNIEVRSKEDKFTISHIGSLLSDRNPLALWEALSDLVRTNQDFRSHFMLQLIGVVSESVMQTIQQLGLNDYVNFRGYLEHNEAIKAQLKSHVLLLIEIDSEDTKSIIPGKLFEYMHSKNPILAVGPKGSDVKTILESTNSGKYYTYSQKEDIRKEILQQFSNYKNGTSEKNRTDIQQFSRRSLTKSLSELLKK
ncbi:glycosyl transferase family 1 [Winogradskyella sp. A3E31]|uniref:glycosyl transferase family 1 n=1 Tax=Winogradskyella sp. A3E31 TaxID=3349637 RepID=UPI00398AF713